jgi:hypothetical protein
MKRRYTTTEKGGSVNIFIRIKAAGKRRDMLEPRPETVPDDLDTAEKLIAHLVRENVRAYNAKPLDPPYFQYLSASELEDAVYTGKVGFGDRKSEKNQDEEEAVKNALQCFIDGIYRMLINETEISPDGPFALKEGDAVTFIRLVMLAGRRF